MNDPFEKLVLIVEDDDDLRYVTTRQLAKLGLKAHVAVDGREALEKCRETRYSLIFMDIMMPEMDGLKATEAIRQYEQTNGLETTPIIAMTAYNERKNCLETGMNDYVFKPVLQEALRIAVDHWLKKGCA